MITLVLLLAVSAASSRAQSYSIDRFTIAGGGTSTGGAYSLSGAIGQLDAVTIHGGGYSIADEFMGVVSVFQTPGAPPLTVRFAPANTLVVSWPSDSAGFALQQTTDLTTPNWVAPPENINDNGTHKFIVVHLPADNRFYRLFKR